MELALRANQFGTIFLPCCLPLAFLAPDREQTTPSARSPVLRNVVSGSCWFHCRTCGRLLSLKGVCFLNRAWLSALNPFLWSCLRVFAKKALKENSAPKVSPRTSQPPSSLTFSGEKGFRCLCVYSCLAAWGLRIIEKFCANELLVLDLSILGLVAIPFPDKQHQM